MNVTPPTDLSTEQMCGRATIRDVNQLSLTFRDVFPSEISLAADWLLWELRLARERITLLYPAPSSPRLKYRLTQLPIHLYPRSYRIIIIHRKRILKGDDTGIHPYVLSCAESFIICIFRLRDARSVEPAMNQPVIDSSVSA